MAIPTGSGSEVLKRATGTAHDGASTVLTCASLHIYTILSIVVCNEGSTTGLYMQVNDGSSDRRFVREPSFVANSTFVWGDKFVMHPSDVLKIEESGNIADLHFWVSYIDQDWS